MATKRILVVDDQQNVCNATKRLLEPEGYRVDAANDVVSAKRLVDEICYDVALIDINLEDTNYLAQNTDGVQVIEYIRSFNEGTRIVVLSAQQSTQFVQASFLELGVNNYISKKETKPDEELSIIEGELKKVEIKRFGPSGDPLRGLSGALGIEADIWTSNAINIFKPSRGAGGLINLAKRVLNTYGPIAPKRGTNGNIIELNLSHSIGTGTFWSRSLGCGFDLIVSHRIPKDAASDGEVLQDSDVEVLLKSNNLTIEEYDVERLIKA